MRRLALLVATIFSAMGVAGELAAQQGTLMNLPSYQRNYSYSSHTRGYWFTAPTDFRIVGIRVPNDTGNDPQNWQVMTTTGTPSGSSHTTVGYMRNIQGNTITSVSYDITQGQTVCVLGARGTSTMNNAYASGGYQTQVLGQSATLSRLVYQNNLYNSQAGSISNGGSGSIARVEIWVTPPGPEMTIDATAGTASSVYSNAQNVSLGTFDLENGATGGAATITEIELTASGSGNDATAYSQVAIYRDDNANGTYDAGTDVQVGSVSSFSGDDGTATIPVASGEQDFPQSTTRKYFIVASFNGSASPGDSFDFEVSDLSAQQTISLVNASQVTIAGATISAPDFSVQDTSPSVQDVFLGSADNVLQRFTVNYPAGPNNTIDEIEIQANGTGLDQTAFDRVVLWRDADANGALDPNTDVEVAFGNFTADNGTLTFMLTGAESQFAQGTNRTYFVAGDFNLTASDGHTFQTRVSDMRGASQGTNFNSLPAPQNGFSQGVNMLANGLQATIHNNQGTPLTIDNAGPGDTGEGQLMLDLTLRTLNAGWTVNSLTFEASGSANDSLAYNTLTLYADSNNNGSYYDSATDSAAGPSGQGFMMDNGEWMVSLNDTAFPAQSSRRFFLVANLSGRAQPGSSLEINVKDASGTPPAGGTLINFDSGEAREHRIGNPRFEVILNGPRQVTSVNNNSAGPTGAGELLIDVTVIAANATWSLDSLTFRASGSGDDATGFSLLTLFEEGGGNDTFDGAGSETLATSGSVTAFPSDNGDYPAQLSNSDCPPGTVRRFYLAGKLSGTPRGGDRFQVALASANVSTTAAGATVTGVPTQASAGVIIDTAVLTVSNAVDAPQDQGLETGAEFTHMLGKFELQGNNGDMTINGITLTTDGTANWGADLSSTRGVELWKDDGDGEFSSADDEQLFAGPGVNGRMVMNFLTPQSLPNNAGMEIFLLVTVPANAGAPTAKTFSASIANTRDVNVSAGVRTEFGVARPESSELTIIEYYVSEFTPVATEDASGGESITIRGSGFTSPVSLTIGGEPADGAGVVSNDGTEITGFIVPAGQGSNLEVVLTTGLLGPRTVPVRFSYGDGLGGSGVGSGGRCAVSAGSSSTSTLLLLLLAAAAATATLAIRRRTA